MMSRCGGHTEIYSVFILICLGLGRPVENVLGFLFVNGIGQEHCTATATAVVGSISC